MDGPVELDGEPLGGAAGVEDGGADGVLAPEPAAGERAALEEPPQRYPRVQLLTAEALLDGARIEMPPLHVLGTTFKKAPRARRPDGSTQGALDL